MDTITHGIAGALIGKAVFRGEDMFASHPMNRGRIITWSLMLGAIFPDFDVVRDIFPHDKLLVITWHRSVTHSLVMLPLWALLLAWITRAKQRPKRKHDQRMRDAAMPGDHQEFIVRENVPDYIEIRKNRAEHERPRDDAAAVHRVRRKHILAAKYCFAYQRACNPVCDRVHR